MEVALRKTFRHGKSKKQGEISWVCLLTGVNMMSGINITSIIVAFVGAVIVLFVYRLVMRGR